MGDDAEMAGPLAPWREGFAEDLRELGYAELTIRDQLRVMAHLSRWLETEGVSPDQLKAEGIERFVAERRASGTRKYVSVRGLGPLLGFLRSMAGVPEALEAVPVTAAEVLVDRYRAFLVNERGLAPRSVMQCVTVAQHFVSGLSDPCGFEDLDAAVVRSFIEANSAGLAPRTVQHMLWSLRSFLKFVFLEGITTMALAETVPPVRSYSAASLPDPITADEARALVESCDTTTPIGLRDRAVLMLMSRLGLRAGEVAGLRLDEVDWRAGEVIVSGKAGRVDRLPLPVDVGGALVEYLRDGRPVVARTRCVFVTVKAPYGPLSKAGAMNSIVASAAQRSGVGPVTPHRLRHGAASQMLAAGATVADIGQVLRHRSPATTAIYLKVDHKRLSNLARPWPGTGAGR